MVNLPIPKYCKTQKKENKIKRRLLSAPMEDHKLTGRTIWNTEKKYFFKHCVCFQAILLSLKQNLTQIRCSFISVILASQCDHKTALT